MSVDAQLVGTLLDGRYIILRIWPLAYVCDLPPACITVDRLIIDVRAALERYRVAGWDEATAATRQYGNLRRTG